MSHLKGIFVGALLLATAIARPQPALAVEDTVLVAVDRAKVIRLDQPVATVIVGNPSIADALVYDPEMLVVTGKSFGMTNLILLDAEGTTIDDLTLHVRADSDGIVTIQRGPTRLSYSCAPNCERTLMIGDTVENFDALNAQIQTRLGLAESQAAPE
jgi:Flp pilus assembly secretin CpaC